MQDTNYGIKRKRWEIYSYRYNQGNNIAIIRFDIEHGKEAIHDGFDNCMRVILTLTPEQCTKDGLPTKDTKVLIKQLENKLLMALNTNSRYVASMDYSEVVEFTFQTNNPVEFERIANPVFKETKFSITLKNESGWSFFDQNVKPTFVDWQTIQNRQTIDTLLQQGAVPHKAYLLEHSFIGIKQDLEYLTKELKAYGYVKDRVLDNVLVLKNNSILDLNSINNMTEGLITFANKINVQYQGWEMKDRI